MPVASTSWAPRPSIRPARRSRAWWADVLCGFTLGGWWFGWWGALYGVLFMASAGAVYRSRRLRREAQLEGLRGRRRGADGHLGTTA